MTVKTRKKRITKFESNVDLVDWSSLINEEQQRNEWLRASNILWNMEKYDEVKRIVLEDALTDYMKKMKYSIDDIRKIESVKDYDKSSSFLITGYLLNKGYNYQPSVNYLESKINKLLNKEYEKTVKVIPKKVDKTSDIIITIEKLEDEKLSGKGIPSFDKELDGMGIDGTVAKNIIGYFTPIYEEYKMAYNGDIEILEGYRHYSKRQLGKICKWYEALLEEIGKYEEVTVAKTRKTIVRKAKPKTPAQLVKTMKYMKKCDELSLESVKSEEIVGAKAVTIFNPKTRKFYLYVAKDKQLSVKGSSIIDFDEEASYCKILRNPDEMIKNLTEGTRNRITKEAETLTTKSTKVSGRVSADMIILKTYRK